MHRPAPPTWTCATCSPVWRRLPQPVTARRTAPLTAMVGSTRTLSRASTLRHRWYRAAPPDPRAENLASTRAHAFQRTRMTGRPDQCRRAEALRTTHAYALTRIFACRYQATGSCGPAHSSICPSLPDGQPPVFAYLATRPGRLPWLLPDLGLAAHYQHRLLLRGSRLSAANNTPPAEYPIPPPCLRDFTDEPRGR